MYEKHIFDYLLTHVMLLTTGKIPGTCLLFINIVIIYQCSCSYFLEMSVSKHGHFGSNPYDLMIRRTETPVCQGTFVR